VAKRPSGLKLHVSRAFLILCKGFNWDSLRVVGVSVVHVCVQLTTNVAVGSDVRYSMTI
jgi:hypothetical protein